MSPGQSDLWQGSLPLGVVLACIAVTAVVTLGIKLSGLRLGGRISLSARREVQVRTAAVGILVAMVVASAFLAPAHLDGARAAGVLAAGGCALAPGRRMPMWGVLVVAVIVTAGARALGW